MNEKELELAGEELVNISLEDILAEFDMDEDLLEESQPIPVWEAVPAEEPVAEAIPQAEPVEVPVQEIPQESIQEPVEEEVPQNVVTGDTVRFDNLSAVSVPREPVTGDTVELENISDAKAENQEIPDDTVRLDDLSDVDSAVTYPLGERLEEEEPDPAGTAT